LVRVCVRSAGGVHGCALWLGLWRRCHRGLLVLVLVMVIVMMVHVPQHG
jgi:hypothetical protein